MNIAVTIPASDFATRLQAAGTALAIGDADLDEIARRHDLALRDVLALLPSSQACKADGRYFAEVWDELASWGRVVFATSDAHGAFEMTTQLQPGRAGRGLFNLFALAPGPDAPSRDLCAAVWLVDRPRSGRGSRAVIFLNQAGDALFKILVRRDVARQPDGNQLAKFEAMWAKWRRCSST
ncbi:hypothetical protein CCR94_03270 [Rhodoblastus sphagnicola]|uniref:Heme utilization protein HuvX n=1 Tax=Rhodoblastus sphagnicola TaxID=333368 RepID=A0A2S6NEI8_9HYPH|nr:ChuX/HutX family heme-like substrate-binding protein [Rhodoblastus sphagnicola]MBB4200145.1 hypothetical protein [Rhodoblastus sphagnicola]PPQ33009.1 hypothetical protein CCR94_03270 [Rhodoblastus sphagnicola]